jgi:hypothetical protein
MSKYDIPAYGLADKLSHHHARDLGDLVEHGSMFRNKLVWSRDDAFNIGALACIWALVKNLLGLSQHKHRYCQLGGPSKGSQASTTIASANLPPQSSCSRASGAKQTDTLVPATDLVVFEAANPPDQLRDLPDSDPLDPDPLDPSSQDPDSSDPVDFGTFHSPDQTETSITVLLSGPNNTFGRCTTYSDTPDPDLLDTNHQDPGPSDPVEIRASNSPDRPKKEAKQIYGYYGSTDFLNKRRFATIYRSFNYTIRTEPFSKCVSSRARADLSVRGPAARSDYWVIDLSVVSLLSC